MLSLDFGPQNYVAIAQNWPSACFVIPGLVRNPLGINDLGYWMPACAGMTVSVIRLRHSLFRRNDI
jgi:hypothetical protein